MLDLDKLRRNWRTTGAGILMAVVTYITANGTDFPHTQVEWKATLISLCFVIWGVVQKDANNHSTLDEVEKATVEENAKKEEEAEQKEKLK